MNPKQFQADMERIYAETLKTYERSVGPWGFVRELGTFVVGAVTFAGSVAVLCVLYGHLHPH